MAKRDVIGAWARVLFSGVLLAVSLSAQLRWKKSKCPYTPLRQVGGGMLFHPGTGRVWLASRDFSWVGEGDICEWDGERWTPREGRFPGGNDFLGRAFVYDGNRDAVLCFGGYERLKFFNETLEWKSGAWTLLQPKHAPSPRDSSVACWDPRRKRVVLFGGSNGKTYFNDTWEWDGKDWKRIQTPHHPPARGANEYPSTMTWDAGAGKAALWNGKLWHYDGKDWTEVPGSSGPGWGPIVSDPVGKRLLVLDRDGVLWSFEKNSWKKLPRTSPWPGNRQRALACWDSRRGRLVILGGRNAYNKGVGHYGGEESGVYVDLWEWDGQRWEDKLGGHTLPARNDWGMVYDTARRRVVMLVGWYSGDRGNGWPSMTWEWDGRSWMATRPAHHPPMMLAGPAMAYDQARGETVLFGGSPTGSPGILNQTWTWDGKDWTLRHPAHSPPPRWKAHACYDAARKRVVLFGGWQGAWVLRDTWEWDGKDWRMVKVTRWPKDGLMSGMCYDSRSGKIIGFLDSVRNPSEIMVEYDGKEWKPVTVFPPFPGFKQGIGVCPPSYDPIRDLFILPCSRKDPRFPGYVLNEIWLSDRKKWWNVRPQIPLKGDRPDTAGLEDVYPMVYDPFRQELVVPMCGEFRQTWLLQWEGFKMGPEAARGAKAPIHLDLPGEGGNVYLAFLSEALEPGIRIPGFPDLTMAPDGLFWKSLFLPGFIGVLDSQGKASFQLSIPSDPGVRGLWLHGGALVLDAKTALLRRVTPGRHLYIY